MPKKVITKVKPQLCVCVCVCVCVCYRKFLFSLWPTQQGWHAAGALEQDKRVDEWAAFGKTNWHLIRS